MLEAAAVEGVADGAHAPVHHVRRRDDVAAGLGLDQRLPAQHLDGLVVDHIAVANQPVLAVRGEGVEGGVAQNAEVGMGVLDGPHCAAHQIVGINRLVAVGGAQRPGDRGKHGDRGDAGAGGLAGGRDQTRDRHPVDPRHRRHRLDPVLVVMDEQRPDQIVDREPALRDQAARPVVAAVAAQARARIAAVRRIAGAERTSHRRCSEPGAGHAPAASNTPLLASL